MGKEFPNYTDHAPFQGRASLLRAAPPMYRITSGSALMAANGARSEARHSRSTRRDVSRVTTSLVKSFNAPDVVDSREM